MSSINLPATFPLVGLGVVSVVSLNIWQQFQVTAIRKEAKVKYPTLYVTEAEAQTDPVKMRYNCVQRAHANTLESEPVILALLGFLGVFHPQVATAFTVLWAIGRAAYTLNYGEGKPEKRGKGLAPLSYVGLFGLLFGSFGVAVQKSYPLLLRLR